MIATLETLLIKDLGMIKSGLKVIRPAGREINLLQYIYAMTRLKGEENKDA